MIECLESAFNASFFWSKDFWLSLGLFRQGFPKVLQILDPGIVLSSLHRSELRGEASVLNEAQLTHGTGATDVACLVLMLSM